VKGIALRRRSFSIGISLALAAPWAAIAAAGDREQSPAARTLHAMFDRVWDENIRECPGWATWVGDHRFDDRLEDASLAAQDRRFGVAQQRLEEAFAIPRDALHAMDRVSLDLFAEQQRNHLRLRPFLGWRTLTLSENAWTERSLYGASCCTSCPPGSNVSVTMGCWPQAARASNSKRHASPCKCRSPACWLWSVPTTSWHGWPRSMCACAHAARRDECA
jgi:hypothetical protein